MDTKKIISIVAVVVAAIAVVGGGLLFWTSRPIYKVNKAIETESIEIVAENFNSLKEEDKTTVADKMRVYCQGISTDFMDEKISYDDAKSKLEVLGRDVLSGDDTFYNVIESIEIVNTSRVAWSAANEAMNAENYEKAVEEFEKVVPSDENYSLAQEKLTECKAKLLPDVVGKWSSTVDLGYAFATMMGMASDDRFAFELTQIYEFNSDGTGKRYADEEKLKETMDGFISLLITVVTEQYQERLGVSKAQLDKAFKQQYGMTMEKYLRSQANFEESLSGMGATDEDFTYTVDGDKIAVVCNDNELVFTREGEEILLDQVIDEATAMQLSDLHVELPMHFTKID